MQCAFFAQTAGPNGRCGTCGRSKNYDQEELEKRFKGRSRGETTAPQVQARGASVWMGCKETGREQALARRACLWCWRDHARQVKQQIGVVHETVAG